MPAESAWNLFVASPSKPSATPAYTYRSAKDLHLKESWFRDVIASNPALVVEPCRRAGLTTEQWFLWEREVSVSGNEGGGGSVDVLLVSASGRLGIVETKLAYNPEKRRSVVAQILDYALHISEMSLDDLPDLPTTNGDPAVTREDVEAHLQEGDHLLVIVGDELDPRAAKLSQAVLGDHLTAPWELALVELSPCQRISPPGESEIILVPSLKNAIRAELRQVVRVTVEGESPKAKVSVERVAPTTNLTTWDWTTFKEKLAAKGEAAVRGARGILDWAERNQVEVIWMKNVEGSFIPQLRSSNGPFYPIRVDGLGRVGWNAPHQGDHSPPPFNKQSARRDLLLRFKDVEGAKVSVENVEAYKSLLLQVSALDRPEALRKFLDVLDWVRTSLNSSPTSGDGKRR